METRSSRGGPLASSLGPLCKRGERQKRVPRSPLWASCRAGPASGGRDRALRPLWGWPASWGDPEPDLLVPSSQSKLLRPRDLRVTGCSAECDVPRGIRVVACRGPLWTRHCTCARIFLILSPCRCRGHLGHCHFSAVVALSDPVGTRVGVPQNPKAAATAHSPSPVVHSGPFCRKHVLKASPLVPVVSAT